MAQISANIDIGLVLVFAFSKGPFNNYVDKMWRGG